MSAREHHSILSGSIANDTFSLCFISDISSIVINPIEIIQVKYSIIVQKLLFNKLILKVTCIRSESTICELDWFLCSASIVWWINCLNTNNDRIIVIFYLSQVVSLKVARIYQANIGWELLFKSWRKFVRIWARIIRICIEIQRNIACIPTFLGT